jgi:hypothetical protein
MKHSRPIKQGSSWSGSNGIIRQKHGSWLMAEAELAALASQCLDSRMADKQKLTIAIAAWEADRNKYHTKADWQFTTDDARIKLKHLYPTF